MKIKIYRDTHRIGSTAIEIRTNTTHIILDMGDEQYRHI